MFSLWRLSRLSFALSFCSTTTNTPPAMNSQTNAFLITPDRAEPVAHQLTLESMQDTAGGYIEAAFTVPSPHRNGFAVTGYVNDEGMINGLPVSVALRYGNSREVHPLAGPLLICGLDTRTGETEPLTSQELAWLLQRVTLLKAVGTNGEIMALHLLALPDE